MSFGNRLEALIQEKGKKEKFSQAELARQLGVQRQRISDWIVGRAEPNMETIKKIAEILGLPSVGQLFGEEPPVPPVDQNLLTEILTLVEKLTQNQRVSLSVQQKSQFVSLAYQKILERRSSGKHNTDIRATTEIIDLFTKLDIEEDSHESGRRKGSRAPFP